MLFLFAVQKIEIGWMAGAKNSASPAGMDRKRRLVGRSTFIKDLKILATYTRDDCVCTAVGGRSLALPSKRVPYTRVWWRGEGGAGAVASKGILSRPAGRYSSAGRPSTFMKS